MSYVKFEKDGLFRYEYSAGPRRDVRRRVKKTQALSRLREQCEIATDVTLGDIFRIVGRYKMLCAVIGQYSWCWDLDAFHAQAEDPADESTLDRLEIYWETDLHEFDGVKELDIGPAFHGIGPPESDGPHSVPDADGMIRYAVDFSPVNSLVHLPVRLNKSVKVFLGYRHDEIPLLDAERIFSLQDVLDAIYWEISFVGGPTEKREKLDELTGMVEDIKAGVIKTVPLDLDNGVEGGP